ncbi:uncharacterized protein LOC123905559 [Trifolium pratense]|uniref:uncharacterized protein LOC123905559 n=1 Tax=Trifolium pratense TaxID=57577 RepID=UPI001E69176E|nr:uncharacterized protein LOC123905559 [Trifolium pratense]
MGSKFEQEREDERVHQFLMGLDDDLYGTLRSNIIAQDPLPSLNRVYSLVVQEERHKTMTKGREARNEAVAFAVRGGSSNRGGAKGYSDKTSCSHCGKPHEVSNCFKIIGYPEWWNNGRGNGKNTGKGKSNFGVGKGSPGVANAAQSATPSFSASPVLTTQDKNVVGPTLTDDQWNTVLNMLKSLNNKPSSNEKLSGPHFEDGDWSG